MRIEHDGKGCVKWAGPHGYQEPKAIRACGLPKNGPDIERCSHSAASNASTLKMHVKWHQVVLREGEQTVGRDVHPWPDGH